MHGQWYHCENEERKTMQLLCVYLKLSLTFLPLWLIAVTINWGYFRTGWNTFLNKEWLISDILSGHTLKNSRSLSWTVFFMFSCGLKQDIKTTRRKWQYPALNKNVWLFIPSSCYHFVNISTVLIETYGNMEEKPWEIYLGQLSETEMSLKVSLCMRCLYENSHWDNTSIPEK